MIGSPRGPLITERRLGLAPYLAISCCVALFGCGGRRGRAFLDVSSYPLEIQQSYKVFAVYCSQCHSLARPLNAQIDSNRHWDYYLARMMRMPGSGISAREAPTILKFLYFYSENVRGWKTRKVKCGMG